MKKIALSIMTVGALFFGTQSTYAQEEEMEEVEAIEMEVQEETFASVDVAELPQAVKDAVALDYAGAETSEAWVKTKDETKIYKLKLDVNGETKKVYVDQDGKWLEKEDKDS
ncbi:hypothetical protein C8P64_1277 [Christiangramia gaetbulicola]|uniref:PepSY domain-containing protein n=1 Tax=Christiangramia gaetbulicola TaxID=703340 RepID=A0A2T6AN87_9FLAO|nr:hypothetical protein [Christiangramia gaetbulicola]PTX45283.1 hypothetical protein C8P64_1277 [Christiangramia gaetbulicola]